VALVGLGGMGKSQLAMAHAYKLKDEREIPMIFWIYGRTRAHFEEGFREIAKAVNIRGIREPGVDILQLVKEWLTKEKHGRWLMILDDADVGVFEEKGPNQKPLKDYLPQSSNGSILITTRNKKLARKLTDDPSNDIIEVGPMKCDEAVELFLSKLVNLSKPRQDDAQNREDAPELVEALGYLPLAISQASSFILNVAPRPTVGQYLEELGSSDKEMSQLLSHSIDNIRQVDDERNSIMTTWQMSFLHIKRMQSTAADLLSVMGFFDSGFVLTRILNPEEPVLSKAPLQSQYRKDLTLLNDFCLIKTQEEFISIHELVQLSIRTWLDISGDALRFRTEYLRKLDWAASQYLPGGGDFRYPNPCSAIRRALLVEADKNIHDCPPSIDTANYLAAIRYRLGFPRSSDALKHWASFLTIVANYRRPYFPHTTTEIAKVVHGQIKDLFPPNSIEMVTCIRSFGLETWHTDEEKAGSLLEDALARVRQCNGRHDQEYYIMEELAMLYLERDEERENFEKMVTEMVDYSRDASLPRLLHRYTQEFSFTEELDLRSRVPKFCQDVDSIPDFMQRVFDESKTRLGPQHPSTFLHLDSLAGAKAAFDKIDEAGELYSQAMEMSREELVRNGSDKELQTRYIYFLRRVGEAYMMRAEQAATEELWIQLNREAMSRFEYCYRWYAHNMGEDHELTDNALSLFEYAEARA